MIRKTVLALSAALLLSSLGSPVLKAASAPKVAKCSTYDFTWYDSSGSVVSTTTTSDVDTTVASPPTGATDYMWIDQSVPNTQNFGTVTPSTAPLDFSDADTNTDPDQAIEVIFSTW